jgi:hypothetical protein
MLHLSLFWVTTSFCWSTSWYNLLGKYVGFFLSVLFQGDWAQGTASELYTWLRKCFENCCRCCWSLCQIPLTFRNLYVYDYKQFWLSACRVFWVHTQVQLSVRTNGLSPFGKDTPAHGLPVSSAPQEARVMLVYWDALGQETSFSSSFPFLSHLSISYQCFLGVTSQINYLHYNLWPRVSFLNLEKLCMSEKVLRAGLQT